MNNNDPFAPWNNLMNDTPFAPHNGIDKDNPFKPWNSPIGSVDQLTDKEKRYYHVPIKENNFDDMKDH